MTATTTLDNPTPTRRDFLYLATGAVGGVGVGRGDLAADQCR